MEGTGWLGFRGFVDEVAVVVVIVVVTMGGGCSAVSWRSFIWRRCDF